MNYTQYNQLNKLNLSAYVPFLCPYVVKIRGVMLTKKYLDTLTYKVIGCAIEVHKHLGRVL